jgi:hypothetical protein
MAESMLQQQLNEVRALLRRARDLFGSNPVAPPRDIRPGDIRPGDIRPGDIRPASGTDKNGSDKNGYDKNG